MKKSMKGVGLIVCLLLVAVFAAACGPPKTITNTYTEAEFQVEEFICQDNALNIDFQPGKIVCTGYLEGDQAFLEIVPKIEAGELYFQAQLFTLGGEDVSSDEVAELNEGMKEETYTTEEGYDITSVVITNDEMVITSTIQ
jgi:hypothetical protein